MAISRRAFAVASSAASLARVMRANDRVRVGIIGTGGRGMNHLQELKKDAAANAEIVALCDVWRVNLERAKEAAGNGPRTTSHYQELLSWPEVDAVIIAGPDFGHSRMLEEALRAGKDVYVEKPFGTDFAEAKAAFLAARASGRVVQAGTQWRSDPVFVGAKQLLEAGAIGQVTRAEFRIGFYEPRWARDYHHVAEADVDWKNFLLHRPARPFDARRFRQWQLFRDYTNGIPGLWMSHWANLVAWYLNDLFPASAVTLGGVYRWKDGRETEDIFETLLEYPSGVFVSFEMRLTNSAGSAHRWYGDKGTIDLLAKTVSGEGSTRADRVAETKPVPPVPTTSHLRDFLDCVRTRGTPRSPAEMGFAHAVAGTMAARALELGRKVRFDRERLELL